MTVEVGRPALDLGLRIDEVPVGSLRLVRADGRRLCLVRTSDGIHVLDHACPHEGHGLTQGQLDGDLLTCAWHNWKFRVTDGECVKGEEDVVTHDVTIDPDGRISVAVNRPDPAALKARLRESLRRGIERDYVGQISSDHAGLGADELSPWFTGVVADHHLSYGHGAI